MTKNNRDHTGEIGLNSCSLPQRREGDRKYPIEVHSWAANSANSGIATIENTSTW